MPTGSTLFVFLGAALVLAAMPGPGMLYVAGRTLGGGRMEGIASSLGTAIGGAVHVAAGAIGVSALIMASSQAFTALKLIGGGYLIYLGIQAWRSAGDLAALRSDRARQNPWAAFRQGMVVEATNPKTAAFFLALLPQFIDPARNAAMQFAMLGSVSVAINTGMAIFVACLVASIRERVSRSSGLVVRLRQASGALLGSLGVWLLLSHKPV